MDAKMLLSTAPFVIFVCLNICNVTTAQHISLTITCQCRDSHYHLDEDVRLKCRVGAPGNHGALNLSLFHNDDIVESQPLPASTSRSFFFEHSIQVLKCENEGNFTCKLHNQDDVRVSSDIQLVEIEECDFVPTTPRVTTTVTVPTTPRVTTTLATTTATTTQIKTTLASSTMTSQSTTMAATMTTQRSTTIMSSNSTTSFIPTTTKSVESDSTTQHSQIPSTTLVDTNSKTSVKALQISTPWFDVLQWWQVVIIGGIVMLLVFVIVCIANEQKYRKSKTPGITTRQRRTIETEKDFPVMKLNANYYTEEDDHGDIELTKPNYDTTGIDHTDVKFTQFNNEVIEEYEEANGNV